jgi:hypothetical protein
MYSKLERRQNLALPAGLMVRSIDGLGLRRAPLPEKNAENHHHTDRKKLALPILERFEPELGPTDVFDEGNRAAAVLQLMVAVFSPAAYGVQYP